MGMQGLRLMLAVFSFWRTTCLFNQPCYPSRNSRRVWRRKRKRCDFILSNLSFSLSASKVDVSKHGLMKFREEKSILTLFSGSFHERYFILNSSSFRMYKDVRVRSTDLQLILFLVIFFHRLIHCVSVSLSVCQSNRPEREWPAKNLKVYLGIKKKLNPPTW